MTPEKTKKLLKRFPFMYRGFYKSMKETCMCWGFDHSDGWYDIIWMLSLAIENELGFSRWTKIKQLFLERFSKKWNNLIYTISPPNTDDFIAKFFKHIQPVDKSFGGDGSKAVKWMKRTSGFKHFIYFPPMLFEVVQVKEKYGTLRYYTRGYIGEKASSERLDGFIEVAERATEQTCEICGDHGKLHTGGWYYVACEKHSDKYKEIKIDG